MSLSTQVLPRDASVAGTADDSSVAVIADDQDDLRVKFLRGARVDHGLGGRPVM